MSNRLTKKDVLSVVAIVALTFMSIFIFAFGCGELLTWETGARRDAQTTVSAQAQKVEPQQRRWYEGGTLHKKTMADWRRASERNRLATCSDFVAQTILTNGDKIESTESVRPIARKLKANISAAAAEGVPGEMRVSEVATVCLVYMGMIKRR